MNAVIKEKIATADFNSLIDYRNLNKAAKLAILIPDHYFPSLYAFGIISPTETPLFFNESTVDGS